jgi:hypothetical protein
MKIRLAIVAAALVTIPAFAGNTPAGPMQAPVGALAVPVATMSAAAGASDVHVASEAGIKGDCLVVDGEVLSCFGVAAEMARINRKAKLMAKDDPTPSACLAHVRFVQELAQNYDVFEVTSSMGGWQNHASALVFVGDRAFLLDNGALRQAGVWGKEGTTQHDWAEVTGLDRSGWHIEAVAQR